VASERRDVGVDLDPPACDHTRRLQKLLELIERLFGLPPEEIHPSEEELDVGELPRRSGGEAGGFHGLASA